MGSREDLYQALRNADAAGDVEAAQKLAAYIQSMPAEQPVMIAPAVAPEKTGMLRAAADIPVQVGRGVAVGVKALSDAFGADNPVSKAASGVEDWLGGLLSAQSKNDQAEIARIMKDAQDKGVGDQVTAAVKAFATAPVDMLSQALGTAVPVIAGGLAGSIARLGGMGALVVRSGIGATMGVGTTKGQIYDAVKQELLQNKVPEAEAERRAQQAQAYGGQNLDQILIGAGLGAAEAAFGAERILTGLLKKGAVKPSALPTKYRIPTAAATEAVPEMAQAAQEQLAQNIALQREGYDVPTMRGVAGQAALEGLAGAGLGALTGAVERTEAPKPKPAPIAEEIAAPTLEPKSTVPALTEPTEAAKPLTAAEQRELDMQQKLYTSQEPKAEELLGEVRGKIQTAPPTTPEDIARIRDEHETTVINSLLEQDKRMQAVSDLARANIERMSQVESMEAATKDADARVRESRLLGRVQSLIDQNIPFASTAIADINRKFDLIGEAPLNESERSRVQNIMTMAQGFTDFVKLPSLPAREQDIFAENQAMEALIKERKPRGQVPAQPVRAEAPAPSQVVQEAPVSPRVEEGRPVRPEGGIEPSVAEDRERVEPVVAPAVEEPATRIESDKTALEEKRQMIADMIETKKANREKVPEGWVDKLTEVTAQLRGESIDKDAIYSMEVAGHPLFDGPPVLRNLIPIKVANSEAAQRALDRALKLEEQVSKEFYGAQYALKSAKTAAQKKAAKEQINKLNNQGWDEDALKTLREETIEELSRLVEVAPAAPKAEAPTTSTQEAAPAVAKEPVSLDKSKYRDTRGGSDRFHGTGKEITGLSSQYALTGDNRNIYGQGFYTTDALDISQGYAKKGGPDAKIYSVSNKPVKLFNMDAPLDERIKELVQRAMGDAFPSENAETGKPLTSLREIYDEFRRESQNEGLSRDDVQDVFDDIRYNLEQQGYRGFEHTGGGLTGKKAHNVKIFWNPEADVTIAPADLQKYEKGAEPAPPDVEAAPESQQVVKARILDYEGRPVDKQPIRGGDVFSTSSGRVTSPYPKQKSEKYATQWLIDNAVAEAESRGDQFNSQVFKSEKPGKGGILPPASVASMQEYLFGEQPDVPAQFLKPIQPKEKKSIGGERAQQVANFEQTLRTTLNKFGLKDVGLNLVDGLKEAGSYAQQLIKIAADSANPIRDLRHEAIHALRELGFFTDAQWNSLSKMAKDKWIDQYLKQRNVDGKPLKAGEESRYDAYVREYNGDMEKVTEEAVADAFADFDATKPPSGLMQALLTRMRNLFQAIKSALTKVESPEQIFGKVERGELRAGERGVAGEKKSLRDRATENFRRWFGNSKVVNENGEPLVVYHGTFADITQFDVSKQDERDAGFWFGSKQDAGNYAASGKPRGGNILPVYLSITNPKIYYNRDVKITPELIKKLKSEGYDGVMRDFANGPDADRYGENASPEWAAFDPTQIKSAIGNNGEYSLTDADIRKSLRSEKPTSTPTAAGQKALDTINQLGMGVQPAPKSKIEEAKAMLTGMKENPSLAKKQALDATRKFMDKFEGWALSADAPFQNALRRGFKRDMAGMEEFIGSQLDASQSQAVGADAVSTQAVLRGRAEYDTEVRKWLAVDDKNNLTELSRQLEKIAEKYGLTKEEAQRVAHTYFVAKNYDGILKRNARIEAEIEQLRAEGKTDEANEREAALVFVSDEQAALVGPGKSLVKTIPELSQLVETWDGIRKNFVRTLVSTGLWSPEYATAMIDNIDYVPFYREEQIEANEGPREMIRGLQVKAKEHKLKGSVDSVNDVFDNMARWMQYAMNRSIRNHKALQMIDIASEMQDGDRMMAVKVTEAKRGMNIVKVWRDGKQELYDMADPIWLDAFQSLGTVAIPAIKYFTSIANMLRRSVVAYPLFSIGQVPQDAVAAIFSSGLKPRFALKIPYLAVKEFVTTLRGSSRVHEDLKRYGAVGVRDFNATVLRQDAEITAGLKAPRGAKDKVMYMLDHIAMSADNAVRQAVYTASMEAGLQRSEAMEKAFDVINFRRRGSSKLLNLMGQTVPFFYAYLSAQRVAYRTLTGTGISPTTRKAALETLAQTTAAVMALSFLYSMANGDDEDYEKTPGTIRDRSLLIPGSGGVRIPLRPDFFLFPKIIGEHTYQLLSDKGFSDGAKFRKAMSDVFANSVLSPNPVPQAIKPLVEIGINYSFFEGRPIVGFFEQNKEAGRQFNESTSEMAKLLGQYGMSPEKVDHFVRGYFGSVGGLALWGTNFFIEGESGVPRPELTWHDAVTTMPGVGAFRQKPNENALKVDFYELRDAIEKAKNTYDDIKRRSPEGLEAFIQDEKNLARLGMEKGVTKIADHLSKIRRAVQQVTNMPEEQMSAKEKQERIKELREVEMEMLKAVNVKSLRAQAQL